jgi:glycosyltransferase involved in cell wall biosynthesis
MTADAVGGVWQYSLGLSEALGRCGHEVVLALLGPGIASAKRKQAHEISGLTLIETGLPLDWLCDGPGPVRRAARALAQLARDESADLVHCNMPTLAAAAAFSVPLIAVTHGCLSTWWEAAKRDPLDPAFHWHRELMREGLKAADLVIAPSADYAARIGRHYGLGKLPAVVHNGVPPLARRRRSAPTEDCVLTIGRLWDPVKGAATLDRVAARLPSPFYAAGATCGPHGERVDFQHLHCLGELDRDQLAAVLARRPVFVSAATFEPFGLAVLEAASAGCALVLSDIPGFRELWGDAALFVPPGETRGYRQAIDWLIGDPALRFALGEAAAARAERYTPGATAKAMIDIYQHVLANPRRRIAA